MPTRNAPSWSLKRMDCTFVKSGGTMPSITVNLISGYFSAMLMTVGTNW